MMGCKLSAEWRGVEEKGMRIDSLFSSHPSASTLPLLLTFPNSFLGVYSPTVLRFYYLPTPFPSLLLNLTASFPTLRKIGDHTFLVFYPFASKLAICSYTLGLACSVYSTTHLQFSLFTNWKEFFPVT
jgi:hypothetical protein